MAGFKKDFLFKFSGDTKDLERSVSRAERSLGGMDKKVGKSDQAMAGLKKGAAALGGVLAAGALAKGLKSAVLRAQEMDSKYAITEKIIEQTGGAAQLTGDQIKEMSKEMALTTGVDKSLATDAANVLLTFKELKDVVGEGNDVFSRTFDLTADVATVMNGDAKTAAIQLGKALNDPIKGISSLGKAGLTFTEDQKKVIKSMVETGDTIGAQKLILDELEGQLGGTAAASVDATARIGNAWDEVLESIGEKVLPNLERVADAIVDLEPAISAVAGKVGDLLADIGDVVVPVLELAAAVSEYTKEADDAEGATQLLDLALIQSGKNIISGPRDALFDLIDATKNLVTWTEKSTETVETSAEVLSGEGPYGVALGESTYLTNLLKDATVNLADEQRKLVDPVFRAKKAQEEYNKTLKDAIADAVITGGELDILAQKNLDLAAANQAVTPENIEAYRDALIEVRAKVVEETDLISAAIAGVGESEGGLNDLNSIVTRLEDLDDFTFDIQLKAPTEADLELIIRRALLRMERNGSITSILRT